MGQFTCWSLEVWVFELHLYSYGVFEKRSNIEWWFFWMYGKLVEIELGEGYIESKKFIRYGKRVVLEAYKKIWQLYWKMINLFDFSLKKKSWIIWISRISNSDIIKSLIGIKG